MQMGEGVYWMAIKTLTFDASRVVPSFNELSPVGINVSALFRVA